MKRESILDRARREHAEKNGSGKIPHLERGEIGKAENTVTSPRWPDPVCVSDLTQTAADVEFLWHGCIARRHTTMLSALMKCGKSTFLGHLLRSLQSGEPFAGRATKETRTLVVSEESQSIWIRRRDALELDGHLFVMSRPMLGRPNFGDWSDFLGHIEGRAIERKCDLVVIDTISAFAPWKSENDSAEVMGTMTPLNRLTEAGLGVLVFHHIGKSDGSEGRAARGSTALAGAVDVLLEMRRHKPDVLADRRRVLKGLSRFEETPEEIVVTLREDGGGYDCEGDRRAVAARELNALLLDVLPDESPGLRADQIHELMSTDDRPKRGAVMAALKVGAAAGQWTSAGTGLRGSPMRFWKH